MILAGNQFSLKDFVSFVAVRGVVLSVVSQRNLEVASELASWQGGLSEVQAKAKGQGPRT